MTELVLKRSCRLCSAGHEWLCGRCPTADTARSRVLPNLSVKRRGPMPMPELTPSEFQANCLELVERCTTCVVCSVTTDGYPNAKAMLKLEYDGLKTFWFSTNTPSMRVAQFRDNPKACVYFVDPSTFTGLMLEGTMEVLEDQPAKDRLWREGFERYYALGVTDPDYCVLRFTAHSAVHYPLFQRLRL